MSGYINFWSNAYIKILINNKISNSKLEKTGLVISNLFLKILFINTP